jgi:predicted Holliday junction resolvase-like endonuclease
MKKAVKIIVLFVIIVSVYNCFIFLKERVVEKMRIEERKKELDLMRKNEEEKRRKLLEEEKLLRETKPSISPTPAPESERIRPTPQPRSTANHRHEVKVICEKFRCKLLTYNEQGYAIYIEVAGPDHSAISDILPQLIQAGVVNFTEHREKFGVKMINGNRMYFAAYTLRW